MGGASSTIRQATSLDPLDLTTTILIGTQARNGAKFIAHSEMVRTDFIDWVCDMKWIEEFIRTAKKNEFRNPLDLETQIHYFMPSGTVFMVDDRMKPHPKSRNHGLDQDQSSSQKSATGQDSLKVNASKDIKQERTIRNSNLDVISPIDALSAPNIVPFLLLVLLPIYFRTEHFRQYVHTTLAPNGHVKIRRMPSSSRSSSTMPTTPVSDDEQGSSSSCYLTQPPSSSQRSFSSNTTNSPAQIQPSSTPIFSPPQLLPSSTTVSDNLTSGSELLIEPESDSIMRLRGLLRDSVDILRHSRSSWSDKLRHPHSSSWLSNVLLFLDELPLCISVASASPLLPNFPLIYVNQAFERTTQYSRHEIIGHNCRFLQHSKRTELHQVEQLRSALRQDESVRLAITNRRRDGSCFLNFLAMQPIHAHDKFFLGVQHDLTGHEHRLTQDLVAIDLLCHLLPLLMY